MVANFGPAEFTSKAAAVAAEIIGYTAQPPFLYNQCNNNQTQTLSLFNVELTLPVEKKERREGSAAPF